VKDFGVKLAVEMIRKLWKSGVRGFHFCTLNLEKSVQRILEELQWHQGRTKAAIKDVSVACISQPDLS
jgi:hypothetical protein